MSFLSGLKVFGTDIGKAFSWFGSPTGKVATTIGENILEEVVPVSTPIVNLFNAWSAKAYNVEALAVAAGKQTGTGVEKAAIVTEAILPDLLNYANSAGVSTRTTSQIAAANTALISFINAMTEVTPASVPIVPTASPTTNKW